MRFPFRWLAIASILGAAAIAAAGDELPPARPVTVEVTIAEFAGGPADAEWTPERVRAAEKAGEARAVTRVRLATLEHVPATAQHGEQVAVPSGRTFTPGRQAAQTVYQQQTVGTIVTVGCRIEENGIVVELTAEQSRIAERGGFGGAEEAGAPPPAVVTLTTRTTLLVPNGETVVAQATEMTSGGESIRRVVLVTATAGEPAAKRSP